MCVVQRGKKKLSAPTTHSLFTRERETVRERGREVKREREIGEIREDCSGRVWAVERIH